MEKKARLIWNKREKSIDLEIYCYDNETNQYYWGLSHRWKVELHNNQDNINLGLITFVMQLSHTIDLGYNIDFSSFKIWKDTEISKILEKYI